LPRNGGPNEVSEHYIDASKNEEALSSDYGGMLNQIQNVIRRPNADGAYTYRPLFVLKDEYQIVKGCLKFLRDNSGEHADVIKLLYFEDLFTSLREAAPMAKRKLLEQNYPP
jgi:hypothetical protein